MFNHFINSVLYKTWFSHKSHIHSLTGMLILSLSMLGRSDNSQIIQLSVLKVHTTSHYGVSAVLFSGSYCKSLHSRYTAFIFINLIFVTIYIQYIFYQYIGCTLSQFSHNTSNNFLYVIIVFRGDIQLEIE